MKQETVFRKGKVIRFLKTLKNTAYFPIQQLAILGDPDFFLCANGRFVALELKKSKDDPPRALQVLKLDWIKSRGGIVIVAYPENWEEVKQQLSAMDKEEMPWKKQ